MFKLRFLVSAALIAGLALGGASGCSVEDDEPETIDEWLQQTWGISIVGLDTIENVEVSEDGSSEATASGRIIVDGLGEQDIDIYQIQFSLADGGAMGVLFSEPDTGDERYFIYDQIEGWIGIGDDIAGAAVSKNPDGTYAVWTYVGDDESQEDFVIAEDGYEALQIVESYNEFMETSPYILLAAYVVALSPSGLEARAPAPSAMSGSPPPPGSEATEPAVCTIFSEFCECAACVVLDRAGECDRCPAL
jgi:hypothetical protein